MRTTDDLNPETFKPFGDRVTKPAPAPAPQWRQVEGAPKGVEIGPDGKMRTNIPLPKIAL